MNKQEKRERLRNRRTSICFPFEAQNLKFTGSYSRFDDGRIAEIFITNHKAESGAAIMANEAAIACSLALQFGCPIQTLARALSRDGNGRPSGPLGVALDRIVEDSDAHRS